MIQMNHKMHFQTPERFVADLFPAAGDIGLLGVLDGRHIARGAHFNLHADKDIAKERNTKNETR